MNRITKYIIFTYLLMFLCIFNVKAECSYQERKALLNAAKDVDVSFSVESEEVDFKSINPNTDKEEIIKKTKYYFNLNIVNLKSDTFIKLTNDNNSDEIVIKSEDLKDGIYTQRIDNISNIITYYYTFYSRNDNCYAEKITRKQIKKPKQNPIYFYSICSNNLVKDSEYCQQFIDKEFNINENDIIIKLNKKIEQNSETKDNSKFDLMAFIKNYWYYLIIFIVLLLVVYIFFVIKKKRSELK